MDRRTLIPLAGLIPFVAAGCGASTSGGGDVSGLTGPSTLSVIAAEAEGSAASLPGGLTAPAISDFAPDADYYTDQATLYVYDPSMESIEQVNEILCFLGNTAYDQMVNQGPYIAQVDEALCNKGSQGGESGQSESGNADAPMLFTVDNTRASNGSPQFVKFWVENDGGDFEAPSTIHVDMEMSAGVSAENPFGAFSLNFGGVEVGGTIAAPAYFGTLQTLDVQSGFLGFEFYDVRGDVTVVPAVNEDAHEIAANVNMFADQTQGVAHVYQAFRGNFPPVGDTGLQEETWLLAFDQEHVLRQLDADPAVCLSRTDFDTHVWRYNLYFADGATPGTLVDRDGGFGVKTATGEYGWASYYGLWMPEGVDVGNGDTLTQDVFGVAVPATYTVLEAPGKLYRHTQHQLLLTELGATEFEWFEYTPPAPSAGLPPTPPTKYLVEYVVDGFYKLASYDDVTGSWTDLAMPELIDTASIGFLGMWSPSLGGNAQYVDGDDHIVYDDSQIVNPSDELFVGGGTVDLYGYFQSMASGLLATDVEVGDIYLGDSTDVAMPHHYVFDPLDMTLYLDVMGDGINFEPAGLATGEQLPETGPYTWGMHSGAMVLDVSAYTATYDIFGESTFYTWETGTNDFNTYVALIDVNGAAVAFDPPLQINYLHSTANDRNDDATYDGQTFHLEYGGPGDLHGFPNVGFDTDGDGFEDRFYPLFDLKDGVELVDSTGVHYIVKATELEQSLAQVAFGDCAALSLDTVDDLPLPDGSGYVQPDIGDQPVITDPPAVINGEVQIDL